MKRERAGVLSLHKRPSLASSASVLGERGGLFIWRASPIKTCKEYTSAGCGSAELYLQ